MAADEAEYRRRPKNLVVHYRRAGAAAAQHSLWRLGSAPRVAWHLLTATACVDGLRGCSACGTGHLQARRLAYPAYRLPVLLPACRRGGAAHGAPERSKSCAMPRPGGSPPDADAIAAAAFKLFQTKQAAAGWPAGLRLVVCLPAYPAGMWDPACLPPAETRTTPITPAFLCLRPWPLLLQVCRRGAALQPPGHLCSRFYRPASTRWQCHHSLPGSEDRGCSSRRRAGGQRQACGCSGKRCRRLSKQQRRHPAGAGCCAEPCTPRTAAGTTAAEGAAAPGRHKDSSSSSGGGGGGGAQHHQPV